MNYNDDDGSRPGQERRSSFVRELYATANQDEQYLMNERQSDFANPLLQQNSVYTDNSNS